MLLSDAVGKDSCFLRRLNQWLTSADGSSFGAVLDEETFWQSLHNVLDPSQYLQQLYR